ncbi:hypothetical protein LTR10_000205 [Elasticomyces elasticus]|nr:hypothetical protein LTR10_000205 [Elasticomyces elasticus]KAK4980536.1 hypothetical protein LTR42_000844 [Elasticomyces elasticus]
MALYELESSAHSRNPKRKDVTQDLPSSALVDSSTFVADDDFRDAARGTNPDDIIAAPASKRPKIDDVVITTVLKSDSTTAPPVEQKKMVTQLCPLCPEFGVSIANLDFEDITNPKLAGYLNLTSTAHIGDLYKLCKEPLWCLYKHNRALYKTAVDNFDGRTFKEFLVALDSAATIKLEDITSVSEEKLSVYTPRKDNEKWIFQFTAQYVHQVLEIVNANSEWSRVFSGAGPGRVATLIRRGSLDWSSEDVCRAIALWKAFLAKVGEKANQQFSTVCRGEKVRLPVFRGCEQDNITAMPSLGTPKREVAVDSFPKPSSSAVDSSTIRAQKLAATGYWVREHKAELPDELVKFSRELSFEKSANGPPDDQLKRKGNHSAKNAMTLLTRPDIPRNLTPSHTRISETADNKRGRNYATAVPAPSSALKAYKKQSVPASTSSSARMQGSGSTATVSRSIDHSVASDMSEGMRRLENVRKGRAALRRSKEDTLELENDQLQRNEEKEQLLREQTAKEEEEFAREREELAAIDKRVVQAQQDGKMLDKLLGTAREYGL